jgi:hypothetical protein
MEIADDGFSRDDLRAPPSALDGLMAPYALRDEDGHDDGDDADAGPSEVIESAVIGYIRSAFDRSRLFRRYDEDRWLKAWKNTRGITDASTQFRSDEQSRLFIPITKEKVDAAVNQLCDVLFSGNKFPISVEPSRLPEGVAESVHVDPPGQNGQPAPDVGVGWEGDGLDLPPGATHADLLGALRDKLADKDVKPGPGVVQGAATFEPALVAAKKLEKRIQDQLDKGNASDMLRSVALDMATFGTGVVEGPMDAFRTVKHWDEETGAARFVNEPFPRFQHISVWDCYPDPDARNCEDSTFVVVRYKMSRTDLSRLSRVDGFRASAIDELCDGPFNYNKEWWEDMLRDFGQTDQVSRYEVLKYIGLLDRETAAQGGIVIPDEYEDHDEFMVECWVSGSHILKLKINTLQQERIPVYAVPWRKHPYRWFGIGVAEDMEGSQTLMNGFWRLAVDNSVKSSNVMLELDETYMVPGQDYTFHPGKVFRKNGGQPGQGIHPISIPNVARENMEMFKNAREMADEATGIPSFSHGQTGVNASLGRTSSGTAMMFSAASGKIRGVVKNVDDYLLRPLGQALAAWNYDHDFDPGIRGDLEIQAHGTDSLMKGEVRTQRLTALAQAAANPLMASFVKWPYLLRELARSFDLDADKLVNNPDEALLQALTMAQMGLIQPGQAQAPGGPPQGPQAAGGSGMPQPSDPTQSGGGTIGAGASPQPGMPGFSANNGGNKS